jgi:hypothetical protein
MLLLALVLASCGAESDASRDAPRASKGTKATTAPSTTTTTVPPPYSFDGSVPPPKLINTGTDYASVFSSLATYASWLKSHRPSVDLLSEVAVVGSTFYDRTASDLKILAQHNVRFVEHREPYEILVVNARDGLVALRVIEHISSEQLVRFDGTAVDTRTFANPLSWTALLRIDRDGRWRLASVDAHAKPPADVPVNR